MMEFTAREDVEAPIAYVFAQVTDFAAFERQALRRGAEVRRRDGMARHGIGSAWDIAFKFRGKDRQLRAEITGFDLPNSYRVSLTSAGLEGGLTVDLVSLSRERTRMTVTVAVEARSIGARLLLQSLRLARGNMNRRLAARVADYAVQVQDRYVRSV